MVYGLWFLVHSSYRIEANKINPDRIYMSKTPQSRRQITMIVAIVIGLVIGLFIKKVPIGLLIGLVLGLLVAGMSSGPRK